MALAQRSVSGGDTGVGETAVPLVDSRAVGAPVNANCDIPAVYQLQRGTQVYDSLMQTVPDGASALTELTATTTYVQAIIFTNVSDQERWFSVSNTANEEHVSRYPIMPRMTVVLPFYYGSMVGIKWGASAAAVVRAQVIGEQ